MHSCSYFHTQDNTASLDRVQSHSRDNESLNEWLVGCSWLVVAASLVAVVLVAANPSVELLHPGNSVVDVSAVVAQVAVVEIESVFALVQRVEVTRTFFGQPLRIQILTKKPPRLHLYLLLGEVLRLLVLIPLRQQPIPPLRDYLNHRHLQR